MGWLFGWSDRPSLIEHLTKTERISAPFTPEGNEHHGSICWPGNGDTLTWKEIGTSTTLRKFCSGNHMWTVKEYVFDDGRPSQRLIVLFMMAGRRGSANGWGYKPVDETMGPCEVTCPLSFLEMVPDPGSYATEWRQKVLAHHEKMRRPIEIGKEYTYTGSSITVRIKSVKPLRGYGSDGGYYRLQHARIGEQIESRA